MCCVYNVGMCVERSLSQVMMDIGQTIITCMDNLEKCYPWLNVYFRYECHHGAGVHVIMVLVHMHERGTL